MSDGAQKMKKIATNILDCLLFVSSIKRYGGHKIANNIVTIISTSFFVAKYWRRNYALLVTASFAVAIASFVYNFTINNSGHWALVLAFLSFVIASFVFVYKIYKFDQAKEYGQQIHHDSKLSFEYIAGDLGDKGLVSYGSMAASREGVNLIDIESGGKIVNKIEFDEGICRYFLGGGRIKISEEKGKVLIYGEEEIMINNGEFEEVQHIAFSIMRSLALAGGKAFFDSKKISLGRLHICESGSGQWFAELGRTTYFCSAVTNDIVAAEIARLRSEDSDYRALKFYPVIKKDGKFELKPFERRSGLSNHIGSMVFALSKEGIPLFCRQEDFANQNAGKMVVSGAGSADRDDIERSGANVDFDLCSILRYTMSRELLEESHFIFQDSHRSDDIDLIKSFMNRITVAGYYRDIRRGAFPVFFGFCRMPYSFDEIIREKNVKRCFLKSPKETAIWKDFSRTVVESVDNLIDYFDLEVLGKRPGRRKMEVSDQIIIYRRLLENETVRRHAEKAFGWEPGGSATPPAS